ncbi:MAG: ankyrin repeat domain-containing protein, partial [Phycisphaerales bacterium]
MKRCNISNISISLALLVLSLSPWADVARAQPKKDLIQAAVDGDLDRVKALVADGENINSVNMMSMTPLVVAAWHDHMDVCEFLVEKGADLNAKDRSSRTALYFAVTNNNKELVELLVQKGADVNITTGRGDNAFSLAKKNGNTEIANFLAKNGAKDPVVQLGYGDEYYGEQGVSRPVPGGAPRQGMTPNIAQTAVEVDLLADPNEIMARIKTFKGLEKIILDLGKKSSTELRYWGQIKYDNRTTLVRYVEKQIEDELAAIKKIAVEEKAAKTTKAIDTLSENT